MADAQTGATAPAIVFPRGPRIVAVPADPWDRIALALKRSLDYLPEADGRKLTASLDSSTLWALAAVLGVWAKLTLSRLGTIAALIQTALDSLSLPPTFDGLRAATKRAGESEQAADLEIASKSAAEAILAIGVASILGWLQSAALQQLKGLLEGVRDPATKAAGWAAAYLEQPKADPKKTQPTKARPATPPAAAPPSAPPAPPAGVGTGTPAPSRASVPQPFPWGLALGITAGALALAGLVALASTSRPKRLPLQGGI